MFEEFSNPNTALAVENVIFFATFSARGYRVFTHSVSRMILVLSGSNPSAMKSNAFSYAMFLVS